MAGNSNERSYPKWKKHVLTAPHYFALLGVHAQSTAAELSTARRALGVLFHPDRNGDPAAHDLMARINVAYSTLAAEDSRCRYLATLPQQDCDVCRGKGAKVKQKGFNKTETTICLVCHGSGRAA